MREKVHSGKIKGTWKYSIVQFGGVFLMVAALAGCGGGFEGVKRSKSPAAYREFIFRNPNHPQVKEIRDLLDDADFKKAKRVHTAPGYRRYLDQHPSGNHVRQATYLVEWNSYYDALSQTNSAQIKDFIKRFPRGRFASQAQERLQRAEYARVRRRDTITSYRNFLERYKKYRSQWTAAADQRLERLLLDSAMANNNERALYFFILDHSKSPYIKEAKLAIKKVIFRRVLGSNNESAMEKFIREHRGSNEAAAVGGRLEEIVLRSAEKTGRAEDLERFLKRFPTSSQKGRVLATLSLMSRERNRSPERWVKMKNGEIEVFRPRRCRKCKPVLKIHTTVSSVDRDFTFDLTLESVLIEGKRRCCRMTHRVSGLRPGEARSISFTIPGKVPSGPPPAFEIRILKGRAYRSEQVEVPKRGRGRTPSDRFAPTAVPPLGR